MSDQLHAQNGPIVQGFQAHGGPYQNPSYQNFTGGSIPSVGQNPLGNMQGLKASLPGGGSSENLNANDGRQVYTDPGLVVYPSGQTVPVNYHQNGAGTTQLPYIPANMFTGYYGTAGLAAGAMPTYTWPYNFTPAVPAIEAGRRRSSSSDEFVSPPTTANQEYYTPMFNMQTSAVQTQHYIAGPIQPMKCADNKSYEMVNLDELVSRDPAIPRAVPALWTSTDEITLAKALQNPEGITNVYIRGFMPDTTDHDLELWASRFGEIESCKAIIEQDTGKCKGFGFVMYYSPAAAENCIRGFFHLGFQASYAQKSRNSRLKDLEDRTSTNIYCTGVPIEWNESDLANHFRPYNAISTKICRDVPSGVSKEVGFARFETREIAERVIREFHSYLVDHDNVKLCLRFADTKAQKQLKQQSQERRNWRSREYSYSVEHTPSPNMPRLNAGLHQISPNGSYQYPAGASINFTPATSVSPPEAAAVNKTVPNARASAWPMQGGLQSITNNTTARNNTTSSRGYAEVPAKTSAAEVNQETAEVNIHTNTPSPEKVTVKVEPSSGKENISSTA